MSPIVASVLTDKYADLIACAPMNHSKKLIINTTGGIGYLYKDRLLFIPHKMDLFRKEVNISFSEVENIISYKIWGVFNICLKITMKSGKVEKFIVDKSTLFYKIGLDFWAYCRANA